MRCGLVRLRFYKIDNGQTRYILFARSRNVQAAGRVWSTSRDALPVAALKTCPVILAVSVADFQRQFLACRDEGQGGCTGLSPLRLINAAIDCFE